MKNKSTKLDTGTTAQTDANTVLVEVLEALGRIDSRSEWDENKFGIRQKAQSLPDNMFDVFHSKFSETNTKFMSEAEKRERKIEADRLLKRLQNLH